MLLALSPRAFNQSILTPAAIEPYLLSSTTDYERRPLAIRLLIRFWRSSPDYYDLCAKIRLRQPSERGELSARDLEELTAPDAAMGKFLAGWIRFEREIKKRAEIKASHARSLLPASTLIQQLQLLNPETAQRAGRIRRFRNKLVHGIENSGKRIRPLDSRRRR